MAEGGGGGADERLVVMLEARISEFEKRMAKAERTGTKTYQGLQRGSSMATRRMETDMLAASARINQAIASVSGRIGGFGKSFVAGIGGGIIASILSGISTDIRGLIGDIADMADAADRVGLVSDEFQGLQFGFKLAGVEQEAFNGGLEKFVDNLGAAAEGTGALKDILASNGIALKNADGSIRDTSELLREFADVVNATSDPAAKMALVTDAFGRGGKAMVGAFEGGSAALDAMVTDAKAGGHVLDAEVVEKARTLDDRFDSATGTVKRFFQEMVIGAFDAAGAFDEAKTQLDLLMADAPKGAVLGPDDAAALEEHATALEAVSMNVAALAANYSGLATEASATANDMYLLANELRLIGEVDAGFTIANLADELAGASDDFKIGVIDGQAFRDILTRVTDEARITTDAVGDIDNATFDSITDRLSRLRDWLVGVADQATATHAAIAGAVDGATLEGMKGRGGNPGQTNLAPGSGPKTSIRPRGAPALLGETGDDGKGGGGKSKGGGGNSGSKVEAVLRDLQTEREAVTAWYAEASALLATATDAQLVQVGGRNEALERLEIEHQERLRGIRDGASGGALANAGTFFGAMATLTAAGGEKMAKAARVTAAAQAFVNVLLAQSQVLADPKLGFWAKLPAMAAIGAAGMGIVSALGGSGKAKGGGGAVGGGASGSAVTSTAEAAQSPLVVTLQGLDPKKLYEGSQIIALADALQKEFGKRGLQVGVPA